MQRDTDTPTVPGCLLDEKEAAAILAVSRSTLRNWRALKQGPQFVKVGRRAVRYTREAVAAFIAGGKGGVQ